MAGSQISRGGAPGVEPSAPTPVPAPDGGARITTSPPSGRG